MRCQLYTSIVETLLLIMVGLIIQHGHILCSLRCTTRLWPAQACKWAGSHSCRANSCACAGHAPQIYVIYWVGLCIVFPKEGKRMKNSPGIIGREYGNIRTGVSLHVLRLYCDEYEYNYHVDARWQIRSQFRLRRRSHLSPQLLAPHF